MGGMHILGLSVVLVLIVIGSMTKFVSRLD